MRGLLLALVVFTSPAAATEWRPYQNAAFSYAIDLPVDLGKITETSDSVTISSPTATLTVFGLDVAPMDFATVVDTATRSVAGEGFAIVDQITTPDHARFRGVDGAQHLAGGLVALCNGTAVAGYELRYMTADIAKMNDTIDRLTLSLKPSPAC